QTMPELLRRLRWLLNRSQHDQDLDEELRHHREQSGAPNFGNLELLKEDSRSAWTFIFWEQLTQDIRYGLRAMAASKLFTAMAILSLALGIGANTAIYSFMDAILLRSLPVNHPEELVIVNWHSKDFPAVAHPLSGSAHKDPRTGLTSGSFPWP